MNCHFDEHYFPSLKTPKASNEEKHKNVEIFSWKEKNLSHLDLRTPKCDNKVQLTIHLLAISNILHDVFNDTTKITKSHILFVNTLSRIQILEEHVEMGNNVLRLKRDRPIGSKDVSSSKRRERNQESILLNLE